MKFFIYFWWVASEDVETQQKGLVSIFWPETHTMPDKREVEEAERVFAAVPIRITALHQCLPDTPAARLVKAVVAISLDVETRTRMKFHSGKRVCFDFLDLFLFYPVVISQQIFPTYYIRRGHGSILSINVVRNPHRFDTENRNWQNQNEKLPTVDEDTKNH